MTFSVEGEDLLVFRYSGKRDDGSHIQSYLMIFHSGQIAYWYNDERGAYLNNRRDDSKWIYTSFDHRTKLFVSLDHLSYKKVELNFDKTYKKDDCKQIKLQDLHWPGYYDVCAQALETLINDRGDKKSKKFMSNHLNMDSMKPFLQLLGISSFFEKNMVPVHRWQYYNPLKEYSANLDLVSIKYFKNLDEVRKNLEITVPVFNLLAPSIQSTSCRAFYC